MGCCRRNHPMLGCMVFALLYVLSGFTMGATGIVTMLRMPIVFKTGSVIWTGIMTTGMGLLTMLIVVCHRTPDIRKNASLLVLSIVVLVACSVNLVLFEIMEWKEIFGPKMELVDSEIRNSTGAFVAHLVSLTSTVVGLVSSFVGSIYTCCMIDPKKTQPKNMDHVFGDPEMYKHKYLSASPPNFGNPSPPGGMTRNVQGVGRLSSWTFEGPVVLKAVHESPTLSEYDLTDEEPDTVVQIESSWGPLAMHSEDEPDENEGLLGGGLIMTVPKATTDPARLDDDSGQKRQDPAQAQDREEADNKEGLTRECSALEIISTRL